MLEQQIALAYSMLRRRPTAASASNMQRRILLAQHDEEVRSVLKPALQQLRAEIYEVDSGSALQTALGHEGTFDLVITTAQLPEQSGLQVLARARADGNATPFLVVQSVHQSMLRVFVSDNEGTILSSRMVDANNLAALATQLIKSSSSRPPKLR